MLDPDSFTAIARLPGREALNAQLAGVVASPITGLVRGLGSMIQGLALQLGQIAEQGLVSGEAPPAEEAPAEEAPKEDARRGAAADPEFERVRGGGDLRGEPCPARRKARTPARASARGQRRRRATPTSARSPHEETSEDSENKEDSE